MTVEILIGDAVARLRELPADSVHCVVTSPPYHGLRDYQTGTWEGGDPACDHAVQRWEGPKQTQGAQSGHASKADRLAREACKCGARQVDQQIGLEASPDLWVARLVEVFREVRRVLRPDGVCFVNVGDGYNSGSQFNGHKRKDGSCALTERNRYEERQQGVWPGARPHIRSLKHKDLIGQPWMLAFALRADGWWLRSEIIWSKSNPMPESVKGSHFVRHRVTIADLGEYRAGVQDLQFDEEGSADPSLLIDCPGCPKCAPYGGYIYRMSAGRPTKAHEQIFLLTKSAGYYYDQEAVREPHQEPWRSTGRIENRGSKDVDAGANNGFGLAGLTPREYNPAGRNARSVWTIATEPYSEAHFAVFPSEIPRRAILAGTSAKGCCPECGAPWASVVESNGSLAVERVRNVGGRVDGPGGGQKEWDQYVPPTTTGWCPTCACEAGEPVPCVVLDCFGGSGTTGLVAEQLGRNAILIELSPQYAEMARRRIDHARARRAIGDVAERPAVLPGQGELAL